MALEFTTSFHQDALGVFRAYKKLADTTMAQLSDEELYRPLDPGSNSIAIILKHLCGNMRSRFTNFLTEDGEKPWRNRDTEFDDPISDRAALLREWEDAWAVVFAEIGPLTEDDMARAVTIRGERHSIMQAILRQVAHYALHIGQIVVIAKHYRGAAWNSPSIPRGQSSEYNRRVEAGEVSQR